MRRAVVMAMFVALLAVPSAGAHGGEDDHASRIVRIVGGAGIDAAAHDEGRLELTAPAGKLVVVHGYEQEPYLKFESGKVFANENAPTTYLNLEQVAPRNASASAAPRWVVQHEGRSHTWHDHRTGASSWTVGGTVDGQAFAIQGTLEVGGGIGCEWISYVAIGGFLCYLCFILVTRMLAKR